MKYINLFLLVFTLLIVSCSEADDDKSCLEDLPCTDDCRQQVDDQEGKVFFYGCYGKWGITYLEGEDQYLHILIPELEEEFQVEETTIVISGNYYENDLPLLLPDPMPGEFYKADICTVAAKLN